MIRAVSRYTVEINKTNSPYFDRVICFVKPEYAHSDHLDLHREAQQLIAALDLGVDEKNAPTEICITAAENRPAPETETKPSALLIRLLPLLASALVGSGITLLLSLIL